MTEFVVDPKLKEWATPRQAEYVDAVNEHGSGRKAATALGVHANAVNESIQTLRARAALHGYSPPHRMVHTVPDNFTIKRVSTNYNPSKEGGVSQQWVISEPSKMAQAEAIKAFVEDLVSDGARGASTPVEPPANNDEDLLTAYLFGDPHFGMRAFRAESGEDFDLAEAERLMCSAIDYMVNRSPPSGTGLLVEIGDFLHADDSSNATPANKNPLDVDGRFFDITQVGLRTLIYTINRMKVKHAKVVVWIVPGNHDPHASWMLALCLSSFFTNDPRVQIDLTPGLYKYLRFGRNLLGAHHGHGPKLSDLGLIMANDRKEDWGATDHHRFFMGHIHHKQVQELPGVTVESLNTLAPSDAWHAGHGYRSSRSTQMAVFHAEHGESERHICAPSRLRPARAV